MNSIVLARYSESLDWIAEIPDDFTIFIYNKGERITSRAVLDRADHIVQRPNVGRESESYLFHMLTAVGNDDDFTVYSQGSPFLHSPDFIALLKAWHDWDDVQALSWCWKEAEDVPPRDILAVARAGLGTKLLVRPELFSLNNWGPLEFHDRGARGMGLAYTLLNDGAPEAFNIASHVLRRCKLDYIADQADNHMVGTFSYGAIFAARNSRVAPIPRDSLALMRAFASEPIPCHGYMLERLWLHLCGLEFTRPKSRSESGRAPYSLPEELVPILRIRES
jgi:hypothetical protein